MTTVAIAKHNHNLRYSAELGVLLLRGPSNISGSATLLPASCRGDLRIKVPRSSLLHDPVEPVNRLAWGDVVQGCSGDAR